MKHVFNNSELSHVWAHQRQEDDWGRGNNMEFRGPTIYSYGEHFPIATWVENKAGERAIIFTTRDYSSSTGRHKNLVDRAIPPDVPVFRLPLLPSLRGLEDKEFGVASYRDRIKEQIEQVLGRRSEKLREWNLRALDKMVDEANSYREFFGLRGDVERFEVPADFEKLKIEWAARKLIQDERDRVENEKRQAKWAERARQQQLDFDGKLALWLKDELSCALPYNPQGKTYLRIRGNEIETSQGAKFPIDHARRAFAIIKRAREAGQEYVRNGYTIHLGIYAIDKIEVDGTVVAGCHRVEWDEIARIGAMLEQEVAG